MLYGMAEKQSVEDLIVVGAGMIKDAHVNNRADDALALADYVLRRHT